MAQTYYGMLTAIGEAKDANAKALGIPLVYTDMAVGDGNGVVPVPDPQRTALVNQVRRAPLNALTRDAINTNQVIAEQVIPENVGGWYIRELGLYDADGDLVAIANCPETYKPLLAEGSGRVQTVRLVIIVSSADNVQLKIDPSVVLATRKYVDDGMSAHHAATDPHQQYWNDSRGDAKVQAAIDGLINGAPAALNTLGELADAINNDAHFAANILQQLAQRPPSYSITSLPHQDRGPIIIAEMAEVWVWTTSVYYTGYRSPQCGRPLDGHTTAPLPSEIDAVGGVLSKTVYAGLWGYARENDLVLTQEEWTANIGGHYFVDVDTHHFRVPDLRNMFRRYAGTDVDTANARGMGSRQIDAFKTHAHAQNVAAVTAVGGSLGTAPANIYNSQLGGNTSSNGGPETRPVNTAYAPRIHV